MNLAQKAILAQLWHERGHAPGTLDISAAALATLLECDPRVARRHLADLIERGEIGEAQRPAAELAAAQTVRRLRVENLRLPPGPSRVVADPQGQLFDRDEASPPDNSAQKCPDKAAQDCPPPPAATLSFEDFRAAQAATAMQDATTAAGNGDGRADDSARDMRERPNVPRRSYIQMQSDVPDVPTSRNVHTGVNGADDAPDNPAPTCPPPAGDPIGPTDADAQLALSGDRATDAGWKLVGTFADLKRKLHGARQTDRWLLWSWALLHLDGLLSDADLWECVEAGLLKNRDGTAHKPPAAITAGAIVNKLVDRIKDERDPLDRAELDRRGLWDVANGRPQLHRYKALRRRFIELGLNWDRRWESKHR